MTQQLRKIVGKVLKTAASTPEFFDLNDGERLNWMIVQAFILGQLSSARHAAQSRRENRDKWEDEP